MSTGEAFVGNVGFHDRLSYTAIGDQVNVASRLEEKNTPYGTDVIISEETASLVKDKFLMRLLGMTHVKGRRKPIRIYEPICLLKEANEQEIRSVLFFNSALSQLIEGNWGKAQSLFDEFSHTFAPNEVEFRIIEKSLLEIENRLSKPSDKSSPARFAG